MGLLYLPRLSLTCLHDPRAAPQRILQVTEGLDEPELVLLRALELYQKAFRSLLNPLEASAIIPSERCGCGSHPILLFYWTDLFALYVVMCVRERLYLMPEQYMYIGTT